MVDNDAISKVHETVARGVAKGGRYAWRGLGWIDESIFDEAASSALIGAAKTVRNVSDQTNEAVSAVTLKAQEALTKDPDKNS